jgi:hypothetical protein
MVDTTEQVVNPSSVVALPEDIPVVETIRETTKPDVLLDRVVLMAGSVPTSDQMVNTVW